MKKVGRKTASILLTLCMLLTMLPVSALAADEGTVDTAPAENALAESTPAESTPAETTPAETTPAETTPAETTPAETTPAETTPAETTPAESTEDVAQIGDTTYATLEAAVEAAVEGTETTIQLLQDVTLADTLVIAAGKDIVLDLNNHQITSNYAESNRFLIRINGGALTVTDSSADKGGMIAATDPSYGYGIQMQGTGSSFELSGGTIEVTQEALDVSSGAVNTSIIISGGNLISTDDNVIRANGTNTDIDILGGKLEGNQIFLSSYSSDGIDFSMTGGTYTGGWTAILTDNRVDVTIDGTAVINADTNGTGVQVKGTSTLTVDGGTINGNVSGSYNSSMTVSDGIINGDIRLLNDAAAEISGGSVDGGISLSGDSASVVVTGGTFTKNVSEYLPAGYEQNEDGSVGAVITGVAQIGEETYPTLEAAFAAVEDNQETTITLLKDTAVSAYITIGEAKNVIFDMKGHTITAGEGFSTRVFTNNGTLTITGNGTIDVTAAGANGYGAVNNFGTLTVVDGTYKNLKESNASTFYNRNGGTATFGNPTIYGGGGCIGTEVNTTTTINGGYYENETYPAVENRGNMTITAGTFKNTSCSSCDGSKWGYTIRSGESSENAYLKIQGAAADSVKVTGVQGGLAVIGGTADIYNGVYKTVACDVHTTGSSAFYAGYFTGESYETAVTIYDGTFQSISKTAVLVGNDNPPPDSGAGEASTVMIKGGTFIGGDVEKTAVKVENTAYAKGGASISGGTFSSMPSEEFFAEGYAPEYNEEDGTWGVAKKNEAEINGKQYATLSEALTAVKDGETIKVLAPATVDMAETYVITGKTITLDLNGQTVTWNSTAQYVFKVEKGGLTIQDSGAGGALNFVTSYNSTSCKGIYVYTNGKLTVTGGTISSNRGHVIGATGETSAVTMTGGTVKVPSLGSYAYALYLYNGQHSISGVNIAFDAEAAGTSLYGVYASGGATVNLAEVTVDGSAVPDTKSVVCVYGGSNTTPVTISSGTFKANGKGTSYAVGGGSSNNTAISGGTFNGAVKAAIGKVTGGQFSVQPSAAYLPEGKIYELQQDGYYHVVDGTYVARLGTVGYTSWDALWNDASEGTTASRVYILADVNEITVPAGKNVTFYNSGNCTIGKITNNGTCKIISHAMTGTEVVNNGSLNLGHEVKSVVNNQGAKMEATSYSYAKVTDSITNSGTMTISKGTYPCTITNTGTITLTGGSFAQEVTDWCEDGYTTQKSGDLWVVVKDGPHVAEIDGYWYTSLSAAINAAKDGDTVKLLMNTTLTPTTRGTGLKSTITISGTTKPNLTLDLNGKTISWDQTYASQTLSTTPVMFSITGGANITITGNGTIDTELGSNASYGINMTAATKNQLTIENGTFTGAPTAIQVEKGTLTILDGTFKLARTVATDKPGQAKYVVNAIDANWKDDTANISIQGGSFCFDPTNNPEGDGTSYVAEGFEAVKNEDGSFEIAKIKVAEVGGAQYTSLAEAISNVASGGTITLLCDFVQDDQLTITGKTFTLDMAGKTIILGGIADEGGAILLDGSSNVTITGNGGFTFNDDYFADSSGQMIGVEGSATLTIENGNFYAGLVCVRAGESAKVYIKGGEYSALATYSGRVWLLNLQDKSNAKFYVSGGTFKNYDPSNSDTESPTDNFCTPEYAATPTTDADGNTIYTVVAAEARIGETGYVTLVDAIAAVKSGETITMLTDVTEGSGIIVPSGSNFTIDFADHTYTVVGNLAGSTGTESQCFQLLRDSTITMKNGTIEANASGISVIIQNYADLTLDGMTLDGNMGNNNVYDVLGVNHGNVTITGNTNITAKTSANPSYAFDVYYWPGNGYGDGVTVTVDENMTGTIKGDIAYASDGTTTDVAEKAKLNIEAGTFIGSIVTTETNHGISISGGSFSQMPNEDYLATGFDATQETSGGYWTVDVDENAEAIWTTDTTTEAGNLSDLLGKATSGTIQLVKSVTAQNVTSIHPVTLDLNGNTLETPALALFDGAVVDSTDGKGLLKVGLTRSGPNITLKENNPSLFIYDSEAAGYRLYSYTFKKLRAYTTDQTGDSMGFYFQLTFENLAAWGRLNTAEATHGVVMSTVLELPDNKKMKIYFDQSTIQGVAGSIVGGAAQTGKGFWLTVTGLNKLESGQTLTVTPTLEAAGEQLVISTDAFEYSKTADESN